MNTYDAILKRVSIRSYGSRPVSKEDIEKVVTAGKSAATANNLQPCEFVAVTDEPTRKQMSAIAPQNGPYMACAPCVLAVVAKPVKYYLEDGAAATQNILVMARDLGIGTVWVAGDKKDYCGKIKKLLHVPEEYLLVSLVCLGYPEKEFPVTPKKELKEVLHWEKF